MANSIGGFAEFASDLREFADETADARERVERAPDRAAERAAEAVYDASQRDVPVDEGELRDSGSVFRRSDGVWIVQYSADHSVVVERGSDPHVIEPDDADALSWIDDATGERVFAMRVEHPGTDSQPYLFNNLHEQRDEFPAFLLRAVETVLRDAYG